MNPLSRREFLQSIAAADTGALVSHMLPNLALAQPASFTTPASMPKRADVPTELHIFAEGGHDCGPRLSSSPSPIGRLMPRTGCAPFTCFP